MSNRFADHRMSESNVESGSDGFTVVKKKERKLKNPDSTHTTNAINAPHNSQRRTSSVNSANRTGSASNTRNFRNANDIRSNNNSNNGRNNYGNNAKKVYTNSSTTGSNIKRIINKNVTNLRSSQLISDFKDMLRDASSKRDKGTILEKAVSYYLWEIFEDAEIFAYLSDLSEGSDGYDAVHWIPWPQFNSNEGKIKDFVRTPHDAELMVNVLAKSGCDPLKLSGKKQENAFESLNIAFDKFRDGYANNRTTYAPGELGVSERQKDFFHSLLFNVPTFDNSAKLMIRGITNVVNLQTVDRFRSGFCFVFQQNPDVVISEIVLQCFKLGSSVHNNGYWGYVYDTISVCRKMITLGPNENDIKQLDVVAFVKSRWNTADMNNLFDNLLAKHSIELQITGNLGEVSTYCTACRGALVGESNVETVQTQYMINCIESEDINGLLYCIQHTKQKNNTVYIAILDNFQLFDMRTKMTLGNIIAKKENWFVSVEILNDMIHDVKKTYMYLTTDELIDYLQCIKLKKLFNNIDGMIRLLRQFQPENIGNLENIVTLRGDDYVNIHVPSTNVTLNMCGNNNVSKHIPQVKKTAHVKQANAISRNMLNNFDADKCQVIRGLLDQNIKQLMEMEIDIKSSEENSITEKTAECDIIYDDDTYDKYKGPILDDFNDKIKIISKINNAEPEKVQLMLSQLLNDVGKLQNDNSDVNCYVYVMLCISEYINKWNDKMFDMLRSVLSQLFTDNDIKNAISEMRENNIHDCFDIPSKIIESCYSKMIQ